MRLRRVSIGLLLSACSGAGPVDTGTPPHRPAEGRVQLALGGVAQGGYGAVTYEVSGTATAVGYVVASAFDVDVSGVNMLGVRFIDEGGQEWSVGMQIYDAEGADVTPPLDLEIGEVLHLRYIQLEDFGSTSAFLITDDAGGLVAAVEEGVWGTLLDDGDMPGLTVAMGDTVLEMDDECGTQSFHSIVVSGDQDVTLEPYETSEVTVGGTPLTAYALGAMTWGEDMTCLDLAGRLTWAVVR